VKDQFILAIDQGTTGSTAMIFNKSGDVAARAYSEFNQLYPQPGWVEHDPEEIWRVTLKVMLDAIGSLRIASSQIAAIGITNQRETTVIWDRKTHKPVHNAIVWQCRRTSDLCENLRQDGLEPLFRRKTGLLLDPYFSGTKIKWLLEQVPNLRKRAEAGDVAFGTIDSWLLWKLTHGRTHATDATNASRTLLFNIHTRQWDQELLDALGVPRAILPDVHASAHFYGMTCPEGPLGAEIPLAGIAGDQQAALFGQGCFTPGTVKNTYGTGCFLVMNTGAQPVESHRGLITTLASDEKGQPCYAVEGSVFIAGAAVQWLRDGLGIISKASEIEQLAASVSDSGGVYVVPAFVGLGAPYWDSHARGAILGLTRGAGRAQIARATLEAIAFQTKDLFDVIAQDAGLIPAELRVDGGAAQNDFLMQFQADILDISVNRPKVLDSTATGAAFLAGLGSAYWKDYEEIKQCRETERIFTPGMPPDTRQRLYRGWLDAVRRVRGATS